MNEKGKKEHTILQIISNIWFSIKYLYKVNHFLVWARIPLLILNTVVSLVPPLFIRQILNEITLSQNMHNVLKYTFTMAIAIFVITIVKTVLENIDRKQLEKTTHQIKKHLGESIMKFNYEDLESPYMRDFISLAENSQVFEILRHITGLVNSAMIVISYTTTILAINPLTILFIIFILMLKVLIDKARRRIRFKVRNDYAPIIRKVQYYNTIIKDAQCGKEIRVNSLENWIIEKYQRIWQDEYKTIYIDNTNDNEKLNGFVNITSALKDAIVYLFLTYKVVFCGMNVGDFSFYLSAVNTFFSRMEDISGNISELMNCGAFVENFRFCIDQSEKIKKTQKAIHLPFSSNYIIEFIDVSFKYPGSENLVLKNINLILRQGESLSVVGMNGAGKTTFVKLLCRLYTPTGGEILINGIPLKDIPFNEYSKIIAAVFQDYKLFAFSFKENIQMDCIKDDKYLYSVIEESGLSERVDKLPHGIDTYLYKEFDPDGVELSGGEGQKLAIARALYKNTPIVVLDEPTSALDPIAEYEIYSRFHILAKGKTAIFISHRLSSTRFTDKVAVFEAGEIKEYGSHSELINVENGIYKKMYELQAKHYINTKQII